MMPLISVGIVTAHAPPLHAVNVTLRTSGQALGWPVRMLTHNSADGLRINQKPLPGIGTWGVIGFPHGDERNAVWMGSFHPSALDAITTQNDALDPFIDYESHFSGFWKMLDGAGNFSMQFPDGSAMIVGAGTDLPELFRHTVDASGAQVQIPFTHAERVPNKPTPFNFQLTTAKGTVFGVDPDGNVTVTGATGAGCTLSFGGASLNISSTGVVTLNTESVFNIELAGAGATDALALVSKLVTWLAAHTHGGVTPGSGASGQPVQPITAATIQSVVAKISN